MNIALLIIGIILLVFSVFLIIAVLMQQGKAHNLSGAIAGGAETFFGKSKAQSINKKLSILTTVVAIVFVVLVCVVYILQPNTQTFDWSMLNPFASGTESSGTVEHDHDGDGIADHTADAHVDETTAADTTAAPETDAPESDTADATESDAADATESDAADATESDATDATESDATESDAAADAATDPAA